MPLEFKMEMSVGLQTQLMQDIICMGLQINAEKEKVCYSEDTRTINT